MKSFEVLLSDQSSKLIWWNGRVDAEKIDNKFIGYWKRRGLANQIQDNNSNSKDVGMLSVTISKNTIPLLFSINYIYITVFLINIC